jgi:hypothetical protein
VPIRFLRFKVARYTIKVVRKGEQFSRKRGSLGKYIIDKQSFIQTDHGYAKKKKPC